MGEVKADGYELRPYAGGDLDEVLRLLEPLWGEDLEASRQQFLWKYEQNPYADSPLGVVAARDGAVVGFRGYMATAWWNPMRDERATLLCPGDTCVDPAHRRRGLSVAMGQAADEMFASTYPLYLNLSGSPASVPGYLRLGFAPVGFKSRRFRVSVASLWRRGGCLRAGPVSHRASGRFRVSEHPLPQEMADVAAAWAAGQARWSLHQDRRFFSWRYGNARNDYRFYFRTEQERVTAYVVLGHFQGGFHGAILDCAGLDETALTRLLGDVDRHAGYSVLSICDLALDPRLQSALDQIGFPRASLLARLYRRRTPDLPMLVRPVGALREEQAWHVAGLDVRVPASWDIKGIAFDSA